MTFAVHHEEEADAHVVRPVGELDLSVAGELSVAIDVAIDSGRPTIVIELSEVTFMDSTGLRTLIEGQGKARDAGRRFVLAHPSERIQPILTLTRAEEAFDYLDLEGGLR